MTKTPERKAQRRRRFRRRPRGSSPQPAREYSGKDPSSPQVNRGINSLAKTQSERKEHAAGSAAEPHFPSSPSV